MVWYVPELADFRAITPEERVEFGAIYQQFVSRQQKFENNPELEAADQIAAEATETIDAQVTGDVGQVLEGEIVI